MSRPKIDYSVYYVTGRQLLPAADPTPTPTHELEQPYYLWHLEQAIKGGVTIVQIREKDVGGSEFYQVAKASKEICDKYSIPLIINDRLDVALLLKCGLHLGQTDLPYRQARALLGPDRILGVSINTVQEMQDVLAAGSDVVDYVGIGPCFGTATKKDLNPVLGIKGIRQILKVLGKSSIKAVVIGGMTSEVIPLVLYQSAAPLPDSHHSYRTLDGVAIVSAIAASTEPFEAAQNLSKLYKQATQLSLGATSSPSSPPLAESLIDQVCSLIDRLRSTPESQRSLVHHITNQVVMNDCANLTLALGCSPIMSAVTAEADQLSTYLGCLLINLGTATEAQIEAQLTAGRAANRNQKPIIFDPVGCGATGYRAAKADLLLGSLQLSVVKGNAGEIGALLGKDEVRSRGVDSVGKGFKDPGAIVRDLSREQKCIIGMSGEHDFVSDGQIVVKLSNGHEYQGSITGSGCMTSTAIACFLSLPFPKSSTTSSTLPHSLICALAGISLINVAAEIASTRSDVQGPNTFRAALIDECFKIQPQQVREKVRLQIV